MMGNTHQLGDGSEGTRQPSHQRRLKKRKMLLLLLPPPLLLLLALPAWVLAWVPGGVVPGDGVLAARERATSWVWASTGFVLLLCPVQLRFPSPSHTALAERATCGVVAALTSLPG